MTEYKTLKKKDLIALKRQYVYSALLWHMCTAVLYSDYTVIGQIRPTSIGDKILYSDTVDWSQQGVANAEMVGQNDKR